MVNYYETLRVDTKATSEEIERAYEALLKIWSQEHQEDNEIAREILAALYEAKATLSDPSKRRQYDEMLEHMRSSKYGLFDDALPGRSSLTSNAGSSEREENNHRATTTGDKNTESQFGHVAPSNLTRFDLTVPTLGGGGTRDTSIILRDGDMFRKDLTSSSSDIDRKQVDLRDSLKSFFEKEEKETPGGYTDEPRRRKRSNKSNKVRFVDELDALSSRRQNSCRQDSIKQDSDKLYSVRQDRNGQGNSRQDSGRQYYNRLDSLRQDISRQGNSRQDSRRQGSRTQDSRTQDSSTLASKSEPIFVSSLDRFSDEDSEGESSSGDQTEQRIKYLYGGPQTTDCTSSAANDPSKKVNITCISTSSRLDGHEARIVYLSDGVTNWVEVYADDVMVTKIQIHDSRDALKTTTHVSTMVSHTRSSVTSIMRGSGTVFQMVRRLKGNTETMQIYQDDFLICEVEITHRKE